MATLFAPSTNSWLKQSHKNIPCCFTQCQERKLTIPNMKYRKAETGPNGEQFHLYAKTKQSKIIAPDIATGIESDVFALG